MAGQPNILLITAGLLWLAACGLFCVESIANGERRAALVAVAAGGAGAACLILVGVLTAPSLAGTVLIAIGLGSAGVLFALPVGQVAKGHDTPQSRYDERDIVFSRARLEPGTAEYDEYYCSHPERRSQDDRMRSAPGLLSSEAQLGDRLLFASPIASFEVTESLRHAVDGPVSGDRMSIAPEAASRLLKALAQYYGAMDVGVAALKDYHLYSHVGRGSGGYGARIRSDHRYGIAFTVEMARAMVAAAPTAPTVMESARQYVEAARVAVQLAGVIRSWGWSARAHIDGNYQVIAPLVARDAGLGEIGRMGLLMTPKLGPRVRLGAVTTTMELVPDERYDGTSAIDFCTVCRKCVENCPPNAIPSGERLEIDGALRWRIDSDACYRYWTTVGTDCARCIAVCPYSHSSTPGHNLVRWGVKRSGAFRRLAVRLDDLFYGARPSRKPPPSWLETIDRPKS